MNKMQDIIESMITIIDELHREKEQVIIAIDGRCGSGKSTVAKELQKHYACNVIQVDHFFLRLEQRTEERLKIPGENVDHERFLEEVLQPLKNGNLISYCPYQCQTGSMGDAIKLSRCGINIVEGAYSCHSSLWDYYDLRVFLTVDSEEQLRRIALRNGNERLEMFKNKWIPLEEQYFEEYKIEERCDICYRT